MKRQTRLTSRPGRARGDTTALALSFALMAGSGTAAAQAMKPPVPADTDLEVGAWRVRPLQDARFQLPLTKLKGVDPKVASALAGGDSAWVTANAFLVRMPNRVVLVDAGVGVHPDEDSGHLVEQLKRAGLEPAAVDLVLVTHFHFDHIGGLTTADGKAVFPNAVVRPSQAEHDHWMRDPASIPEAQRERAAKIRGTLAPYVAAGRYRPFTPADDLGPGIRAVPAGGHTPGHTVYVFDSKGEELWCIGDLVHVQAVQLENPSAWMEFDSDSVKAVAARLDLFGRAAAGKVVLGATHFAELVRLRKKGDGFEAIRAAAP